MTGTVVWVFLVNDPVMNRNQRVINSVQGKGFPYRQNSGLAFTCFTEKTKVQVVIADFTDRDVPPPHFYRICCVKFNVLAHGVTFYASEKVTVSKVYQSIIS